MVLFILCLLSGWIFEYLGPSFVNIHTDYQSIKSYFIGVLLPICIYFTSIKKNLKNKEENNKLQ